METVFRNFVLKRLLATLDFATLYFELLTNEIMHSENEPKEMVKSCIDLANITKELKDKNEQASIQQELERLFLRTRGRGRGDESR